MPRLREQGLKIPGLAFKGFVNGPITGYQATPLYRSGEYVSPMVVAKTVKTLIILIAMVVMGAGALHSYQKRNLLIQAALYSEGFNLSESVKVRVADHYVQHGVMPHDNQSADLPPEKSIYGTSVKRVSVNRSGVVLVDFEEEIGALSMIFSPSISPVSGVVTWRCTSDTIDPDVLTLLKPRCDWTAATKEGRLLNAIANSQEDEVASLLAQGANPDGVVNGNSPLMLAAKVGNTAIVKLLLERGASVDNNALNSERRTPLMVAITSNNADIVSALLAQGASVTRRDYKGLTAQDHAVNTDRRLGGERYELMVLARLNPNFAGKPKLKNSVGRSDSEQMTHLIGLYDEYRQAANDCHIQRLSRLLATENDFNAKELIDGEPLFNHITKPACRETLAQFIKTKPSYQKSLDAKVNQAAVQCNVKLVDELLSDNDNINVLSSDGRQSIVERSVSSGCANLVSFLIRRENLSGELSDNLLMQAIRQAPQSSVLNLVGVLIEADIDTNVQDKQGQTALAAAISLEQPVVAKYLVDAGAQVNAPTMNKSYPLIEATKKGYNHLVTQLIRQGADINQKDSMGRTALLAAVAKGDQRLVDTLLRSGANALLKDQNGINAVILAESKNYRQIYTQLTASASN